MCNIVYFMYETFIETFIESTIINHLGLAALFILFHKGSLKQTNEGQQCLYSSPWLCQGLLKSWEITENLRHLVPELVTALVTWTFFPLVKVNRLANGTNSAELTDWKNRCTWAEIQWKQKQIHNLKTTISFWKHLNRYIFILLSFYADLFGVCIHLHTLACYWILYESYAHLIVSFNPFFFIKMHAFLS